MHGDLGARIMGGATTGYAGTSAGFSLAATTFIAGLDTARTSHVFTTTFGMMLIGFLILVGGTSIASSIPTAPQFEETPTCRSRSWWPTCASALASPSPGCPWRR